MAKRLRKNQKGVKEFKSKLINYASVYINQPLLKKKGTWVKTDNLSVAYVGIDASSTSTGVTVITGKEITLHNIAPDKSLVFDDRVLKTLEGIIDIISKIKAHYIHVGLESSSFSSMGRVSSLAMLNGSIYYSLMIRSMISTISLFTPSEIKKFYTGNGKADKQDMLRATNKDEMNLVTALGIKKIDDVIDSIAIAKLTKYRADTYKPNFAYVGEHREDLSKMLNSIEKKEHRTKKEVQEEIHKFLEELDSICLKET